MKDRVIFITGNLDASTEKFIKDKGIKCVLKPFKISELLKAVDCHRDLKPSQ